ncbi:DnaJ family domain-containing protein [Rhodococcus koreensis]
MACVTERKPPGVSFESWIDKQIRLAQERGDFDDLPGAGKPIPAGDVDDELWWVKNYLRRENLPTDSLLPTPLQLRKEIERLPDTIRGMPSEQAVRDVVAQLNLQIVEWLRAPSGPRIPVSPVDADEVVATWRQQKQYVRKLQQAAHPQSEPAPDPPRAGRRWWRRGR